MLLKSFWSDKFFIFKNLAKYVPPETFQIENCNHTIARFTLFYG